MNFLKNTFSGAMCSNFVLVVINLFSPKRNSQINLCRSKELQAGHCALKRIGLPKNQNAKKCFPQQGQYTLLPRSSHLRKVRCIPNFMFLVLL
jgi:hypothetical protein